MLLHVGPNIPHSVSNPGISANLFAKKYRLQIQKAFQLHEIWKKKKKKNTFMTKICSNMILKVFPIISSWLYSAGQIAQWLEYLMCKQQVSGTCPHSAQIFLDENFCPNGSCLMFLYAKI